MKAMNLVLSILSVLSIFLNSCSTTEPEDSGYHNKILFTSSRSGTKQLYMMNPDGTNIKQITSGEDWHDEGRWSPDAQRIVCNTHGGESTADYGKLIVINSDGSGRIPIGNGSSPTWSPDGKKIVVDYSPWAELGLRCKFIYILNADGTDIKQITFDSLETITSPCWSKNGDKIYFVSNRHEVTNLQTNEFYYMDTDGSNVTRLTYMNGRIGTASLSPSGNKLAYTFRINDEANASIYMCNSDGSNLELIFTPPENFLYGLPRWSPDEKYIIFRGRFSGTHEKNEALYRIGIVGANMIKLADNATNPDWSK